MKVTFWGCRGSFPVPGPATVKYGGNTSSIELRNDDHEVLLLDCGSGIREAGMALAKESPLRVHVLVTHTHLDHITGFPFLSLLYIPGNEVKFMGPADMINNKSLEEVLTFQLNFAYFPVRSAELMAKVTYQDINAGAFELDHFAVQCRPMNHKVFCLGCRIQADGKTVVFTGDHEHYRDTIYQPDDDSEDAGSTREFIQQQNQMVTQFCRDADLLICDGQYTQEEYKTKAGWGHMTMTQAIEMAVAARVKRVCITHHDPLRTDAELDELEPKLQAILKEKTDAPMEFFFARDRMSLQL